MDLKTIILNEAADEVRQNGGLYFMNPNEAVYQLALDRLDKVMRWAMMNGWQYTETPWPGLEHCNWVKSTNNNIIRSMQTEWLTDAELYEEYGRVKG